MPQMAPLNWMMLFIYFSFMLLIFNSMNYFSFMYNPKFFSFKKKLFKINWKW
uniref:ATP synthase complex subunit 8 n=1 Tax=Teredus cylindricus TaxID=295808 RepID=A0A343C5A5_TERCY|nr:ATP synthase F0 subunit 8 [Teredus cylindricus]